jgi:hypothetical protein
MHAADSFDPRDPPTRGAIYGHPIPDLAQIPQEHWLATLVRVPEVTYSFALEGLTEEERKVGIDITGEARLERHRRTMARQAAAARPRGVPHAGVDGSGPGGGAARQVNFRVSPAEFRELERAARHLSLRPASAARMLTMRSVQQVLREAD